MPYPSGLTLRIWLFTALGFIVGIAGSRLLMPSLSLAAHLPSTDGILLVADIDKVRAAGALEALAGKAGAEEKEYADFVAATGFDYRRHLHGLAAAILDDRNYFVVEGQFNREKLEAYSRGQGGACTANLCRLPATQRGKWISWTALSSRVLLVAVAANDSEVLTMIPEQPGRLVVSTPLYLRMRGQDLARLAGALESLKPLAPAMNEIRSAEAEVAGQKLETRITLADEAKAKQALPLLARTGTWKQEQNRLTASWPLTALLP